MVDVCLVLGILLITGASYAEGNNCETTRARGPPCFNDGECVETESGFKCICPDGTGGPRCEFKFSVVIVKDPCESQPCKNGGICAVPSWLKDREYWCHCVSGFIGDNCETDEDDCALASLYGEPCENGGTCRDGVHGYSCDCPDGVSGDYCEIVHRYAEVIL